MGQLNIHLTGQFEKMMASFMRLRGIRTKSEAVRTAVRECLERARAGSRVADFTAWLGAAKGAPLNPNPRFGSHADLWKS